MLPVTCYQLLEGGWVLRRWVGFVSVNSSNIYSATLKFLSSRYIHFSQFRTSMEPFMQKENHKYCMTKNVVFRSQLSRSSFPQVVLSLISSMLCVYAVYPAASASASASASAKDACRRISYPARCWRCVPSTG